MHENTQININLSKRLSIRKYTKRITSALPGYQKRKEMKESPLPEKQYPYQFTGYIFLFGSYVDYNSHITILANSGRIKTNMCISDLSDIFNGNQLLLDVCGRPLPVHFGCENLLD
ncbi:hypothetical protein TNCT_41191 [Trichonephila clavata]|uniref:Uncharacterized protein n=1 Tax=Trichonephila clavata TaxID=2740835 RepID=A0A8X6HDR4_TRICU|nr:hypothetical protein TNCT_41191 [Trichonephila clavata]